MKAEYVYVVLGPSPEWGDGQGVIGYAATPEQAEELLRQEAEDELEYGPRSWRSVHDCGDVEAVPVEEFIRADVRAEEAYRSGGLEGLLEYLNGLL